MKLNIPEKLSSKLIEILNNITTKVKLHSEYLHYSHFQNTKEVISLIDSYIKKIQAMEWRVLQDLKMMFAPTSFLQDIAIDNGWGEDFIDIASHFDNVLEKIINFNNH